jgi:hypothetical protein
MIVLLEKGGLFSRIYERITGKETLDALDEMSTLKKIDSGLPVNIWVDDTGAYIRGGHAKRIKFQGDYGNKTNAGNLFSMIISKDDPQIPVKQLPKLRLPAKDIDMIKTFVKNNADLLDKLADEKITFAMFIRQMKV